MSFADEFVQAWSTGGQPAAFALVKGVFCDPARQKRKGKPTDFLHDDEDEADDSPAARRRREREARKNLSPGQGFAELVDGFKPKRSAAKTAEWILDRIEESITEEPEWNERHAFQPWNLLEFQLGFYERLDVIVESLHVTGDKRMRQFGLQHEIVGDRDATEEYQFTYDLCQGDELELQVPGKVAHALAKAVIYAPYLREVIDALVASERFAKIPKALPFRFTLRGHEYSEAKFVVELAPTLDAAALETHPLRAVYAAATKTREVSRDERFLYALRRARQDPGALDEVVALVHQAPDLVEALRTVVADQIERVRVIDAHGTAPSSEHAEDTLVGKLRAFAPSVPGVIHVLRRAGAAEHAHALAVARLDLPAPQWAAHGEDAIDLARQHLAAYQQLLQMAPDEERARLIPHVDAAIGRLASATDPLVALEVLESQVPPDKLAALEEEDSDEDDGEEEDSEAAAFDELPPAAKVLVTEGSQRYVDAVIASIAVRKYGRLTDETVARLKALGAKARAAEAPLRAVLAELCADGYNHDSEVASLAEVLWRIGAEDVPDEVHAAHRSNQFYMEAFYPKWAQAAPARKLARLLARLRAEPADATSPRVWEEALYDSAPGFKMYREAIAAAPERDAWIAGLVRALADAGDVVFRFARDWARASKNDPALALALLEPIEARLDDGGMVSEHSGRREYDKQQLRRVRVRRLTEWLDTDAPEADGELARLQVLYPDDPTISYLVTMRVARREGPRTAGERTIAHARKMSADDIVYRKAFFLYTQTGDERWESVDPAHAFALHELAEQRLRKRAWTDGKLDADPHELDSDPLYEGLEYGASELTTEQLTAMLAGTRRAVDVLEGKRDDLVAALDRDTWEVTWLVAKQLARDPSPAHVARLVEAVGWFADDDDRRRALATLLWPLPGAKAALLASTAFRAHIADFIRRYPLPSDQLAREIFAHYTAAGEYAQIIAIAETLQPRLVTEVALSILPAYQKLGRWNDAIELLRKLQKATNAKAPEWVLHAANIAAMQSRAGHADDAEATLDDLFARDWSRFDYGKPPDSFAVSVLGGDLDVQYAQVFRRYWAQAKFNAACLHAQRGRPDDAVSALREAIASAPSAYTADTLRAEADFAPIAEHPAFRVLLAELAGGAS